MRLLNLGGVRRAAGDTRTVLVASLAGDASLVPLAWLLALTLGLGLRGLMLAWLAYGLPITDQGEDGPAWFRQAGRRPGSLEGG